MKTNKLLLNNNTTSNLDFYNIAMLIEYDGSNFYGFQKQNSAVRTVQSAIELAIKKFINTEVTIINAGRTDTGVHASYQVINFITNVKRHEHQWLSALNSLLPSDIVIKSVKFAPNDFNSRFDAISRTYSYYLLSSNIRPVILNKKVGWVYYNLNIENMRLAINFLLGEHDFSSFRASKCQSNNAIRKVYNISINRVISHELLSFLPSNACLLKFEITANAFLYHMIRNIMGAIIYVGQGRLSVSDFYQIFIAKDRTKSPPTFMPDGLYLSHVEYNNISFNNC